MADNLERFVDTLPERGFLDLYIKIHEDNRSPSVGLITRGFDAAAFGVGASELVVAYGHFRATGEGLGGFDRSRLAELQASLASYRVAERTWAELYFEEGEFWRQAFAAQLYRRQDCVAAIGRGDIGRVELLEYYRENPWVYKLRVAGLFVAGLLGLSTAGIQLMQEINRPACIQQAADAAQRDKELLRQMAKFEGRYSANHEAAWRATEDAYKAQIAACGASWRNIDVEFEPQKGHIHFRLGPNSPK